MMRQIARQTRVPLVSCNLVGGNDGLVFDGASSAFDAKGRVVARGEAFREDFWTIDLPGGEAPLRAPETEVARLRRALVLALADYASKCGFSSAVLGLSGGIDSAVTAALAVEALGAGNVVGVAMPGPYSSEGSVRDARELARRLRMRLLEIPIGPVFEAFRAGLAPAFGEGNCSAAEENLQARIRGAILMSLSNRFGHLVLSAGNKSELAAGYCTLYGDMAGGYALLPTFPKTLVYRLARGSTGKKWIPEESMPRSPRSCAPTRRTATRSRPTRSSTRWSGAGGPLPPRPPRRRGARASAWKLARDIAPHRPQRVQAPRRRRAPRSPREPSETAAATRSPRN
jgi:NAD+ synthetase